MAMFRLALSSEIGVPVSRDTIWNLYRRFPRLQRHLIRPQREGSLWHSTAVSVAHFLYNRMRPWGPYRRAPRPVVNKPPRKPRPTAEEKARLKVNIETILNRKDNR